MDTEGINRTSGDANYVDATQSGCVCIFDAVQLLLVAPSLKSGATYLLSKTSVCLFGLLWTLAKLENFIRFQKFQTKICFRTF